MAGCCLLADYLDVASTSLLVRMQFVYAVLRRLIVRQLLMLLLPMLLKKGDIVPITLTLLVSSVLPSVLSL